MSKNIYKAREIDTIFKNCVSHKEVFEACKIFRQLHEEGKLTESNYKVASQFSILRFKELTQQ